MDSCCPRNLCLLLFSFICRLPFLDNFLHHSFMYLWNQMGWLGVLGKMWKGFNFRKDSYVIHVWNGTEERSLYQSSRGWHSSGKILSTPPSLIFSFPSPVYTPVYDPVFTSCLTAVSYFSEVNRSSLNIVKLSPTNIQYSHLHCNSCLKWQIWPVSPLLFQLCVCETILENFWWCPPKLMAGR